VTLLTVDGGILLVTLVTAIIDAMPVVLLGMTNIDCSGEN
jgi:hypothetical protein